MSGCEKDLSTEHPWACILPTLALAVLVDQRVRDPELVEFTFEAQAIGAIEDPDRILPRKHCLDWFNSIREGYLAELRGPNRDTFITDILSKVEGRPLQQMLLTSIFGICVCDNELHGGEQDYLKAAMQAWNVDFVRQHAHIEY